MQEAPLILLGSARKDSDTRRFLQRIFQGTPHELIDLLNYTLLPYRYKTIIRLGMASWKS
ncbi:hypothetical protein [Rufibacter sp. XAAS-G3-1]|uniref:hypothetical protein n=1 Tax=Rufibacter sp. XAAS-G3-1 TaxID=2729134 RepID=UPI0015E78443|nr:hypothetical protein [Rufibacter sp. XAAS-G3-1]